MPLCVCRAGGKTFIYEVWGLYSCSKIENELLSKWWDAKCELESEAKAYL